MPYSSRADLYAWGIPRGGLPNPAKPLDSLLSSTCTLDEHGFETGDAIQFRPAGDGTLPAELTAGTTYYAQRETPHAFKVRATPGGPAVSITNASDPVVVIAPVDYDSAIAWADAVLDDMLVPLQTPLTTVPELVRMTSAELAAGKLLATHGGASKALAEIVAEAQKRIARWRAGQVPPGADPDTRDNLSTGVSSRCDSRGWNRWGGL